MSKIQKKLKQLNSKKTITTLKMSKGPEHTFLKRRHTNGQQEHEKMFNMTNYIMEMQIKTMSYHHTAVKMAIIKKTESHMLMRVWKTGNPCGIHTHTHTQTHRHTQ